VLDGCLLSCSRPKGFGFIEFRDSRDAEEALYHLDRSDFGGREIQVRP
jgi:RNA recognition motif-containing protein